MYVGQRFKYIMPPSCVDYDCPFCGNFLIAESDDGNELVSHYKCGLVTCCYEDGTHTIREVCINYPNTLFRKSIAVLVTDEICWVKDSQVRPISLRNQV